MSGCQYPQRNLAVPSLWFYRRTQRGKNFLPVSEPAPKIYSKPKYNKTALPSKVVDWFQEERGISQKVLDLHKIGYGSVFMPQMNQEVNAIQFPYYLSNEIVNIKYRDGNKNFRMEKGAERVLYGLNDINEFCTVIVEGEIDKLSCAEAGYHNCVSVPDGAPSENTKNYSTKFAFLESAEQQVGEVLKWVIAVDNDAPGVLLKNELVRRFGPEKCWIASWPDGCKDANDVLRKHGKEKLSQCLADATPNPISGLFSINDFEQKILDSYEYGFKPGEKTGWAVVDEFYTVRGGEWTLVTGMPGSGKSEWLDALMVNLAKDHGWVFGILSLENLPLERHFAKLAEKYIKLSFVNTWKSAKMSKDDLQSAIEWGQQHFNFMVPDDGDLTVDGVLNLAKILCYCHGINGFVLDPWNELNHFRPNNVSETEHISQSLGKIRRFARDHEIHIWIVAHPTKLKKQNDGKYPVPTPYDVSGSAHWRNKADNAISIHRPNPADHSDRTVEVHVQKIRFKEIGKIGMAELNYDTVSGRYN